VASDAQNQLPQRSPLSPPRTMVREFLCVTRKYPPSHRSHFSFPFQLHCSPDDPHLSRVSTARQSRLLFSELKASLPCRGHTGNSAPLFPTTLKIVTSPQITSMSSASPPFPSSSLLCKFESRRPCDEDLVLVFSFKSQKPPHRARLPSYRITALATPPFLHGSGTEDSRRFLTFRHVSRR